MTETSPSHAGSFDDTDWVRRQRELTRKQQEAFRRQREQEEDMRRRQQAEMKRAHEERMHDEERRRDLEERRRKFLAELSTFDSTLSPIHSSGRWIEENRKAIHVIAHKAVGSDAQDQETLSGIITGIKLYPVSTISPTGRLLN